MFFKKVNPTNFEGQSFFTLPPRTCKLVAQGLEIVDATFLIFEETTFIIQ